MIKLSLLYPYIVKKPESNAICSKLFITSSHSFGSYSYLSMVYSDFKKEFLTVSNSLNI